MAWLTVFSLLPLVCHALNAPITSGQAPGRPQPKCYIPHPDGSDIHCSWAPGDGSLSPAEIHWKPDENGNEGMTGARASGWVIPRARFQSHADMCVWLTAGGVRITDSVCFNTAHIEQPRAPTVNSHTLQPLEIFWRSGCTQADFLCCEVQYRLQDEEHWITGSKDVQEAFLLEDVQPFSVYEFRVRCACSDNEDAPPSTWSNTYRVEMAEAAPVGVLDVWIRCGESVDHSDCKLVWKDLPRRLDRGEALGYRLVVENETKDIHPAGLQSMEGILDGVRRPENRSRRGFYLLPLPLCNITAVNLSAFNSKGETEPTRLALPSPDQRYNLSLSVSVEEHERKLKVSWRSPPEAVDEYVVQIDEMGSKGLQRFDWIKVNQSRDAVIEGDFRNYTPYILSLFGISSNRRGLLEMTTVYTVQDVPPKVEIFLVSRLSPSEVTLTWQPIPLFQRRGLILRYRLGLGDDAAGYEVHRDLDSYTISGLEQGRNYMAWICAETEAGWGALNTITFFVPASIVSDVLIVALIMVIGVGLLCLLCCWGQWRASCPLLPTWYHDRVPDPTNSRLFKSDQNMTIWDGFCAPEPSQKMSCLEVVESENVEGKDFAEVGIPGACLESGVEEEEQTSEEGGDTDWALSSVGNAEVERSSGVNSYSEMQDGDDGAGAVSLETSFPDYEKHFMPRPSDI